MNLGPKTVARLWALGGVLFAAGAAAAFGATGAEGVAVGIRFYDKRVFFLEDSPILIQVSVTNNSPQVYRFSLADDRAFSVDFEVRELTNRLVSGSPSLLRRRTESRQVYFREVLIESGETFSFVEDLRDWASFSQPGSYLVEAKFYPELFRAGEQEGEEALSSNRLALRLRPPSLPASDGVPVALDEVTGANLVREKLPPDEVVTYLLKARQKAQWEKFFLYFDIEALLTRDAGRLRQWRAESEEGRLRMIARYRTEMQDAVVDGDVSAAPMEFEIERTTYAGSEGTVVALEKFKVGGYTERKRYTYYLRLKDAVWTVVDYVVVNLGIE